MHLFPQIKTHPANPVVQDESTKSSLVGKRVRVKPSRRVEEAIGTIEIDRGWPAGFVEIRLDEGEPPPKVRICPSPDDYELLEEGES